MPLHKRFFMGLLNDWVAKVLCLVLAIGLYSFYHFNTLKDRPLSVPLTLITNDELVPASQFPRTVGLVLRGEASAIYAIHENDIEAILDLGVYNSPGTWRVPVRIHKRGTALSVDPLSISVEPSEVTLVLETRLNRELRIAPEFRGSIEAGYELAGVSIQPQTINAYGPVSVLSSLFEVSTEAIDLTSRTADFTERTRVVRSDPSVQFAGSEYVEVAVAIRRELVYRSFSGLSPEPRGLPDGLILQSDLPEVSIRVGGPRRLMDGLELADVWLDLSGLSAPGEYQLQPQVDLPRDIKLESWLPETIRVVVSLAENGAD